MGGYIVGSWNEVKETMSFREEILALGARSGTNISELCRRFQISAKTFYKWRNRSKSGEGVENRSRRPHQSPNRTAKAIEEKILEVRVKFPSWGARKLRKILVAESPAIPGESTVHKILKRHGKIDPSESPKHCAWQRFEHEAPNQLWQMDFKGWFRTVDQQRCHPLTILDDHSRYVVCLQACMDEKTQTVQGHLTTTFRRYGLPEWMTMDNGAPWGNDAEHRYTPLTAWLIRLGVGVSHSRPYHPQTQGKDERFHRTLKADLLRWHQFREILHVQRHFDEYREIYNRQRPHQALGLEVPASRYQISRRRFPEKLQPIEYGVHDIVRKVQQKGCFHYRGRRYVIGKAFSGYPVALRATTQDGVFNIFFCHQKIGTIDLHDE